MDYALLLTSSPFTVGEAEDFKIPAFEPRLKMAASPETVHEMAASLETLCKMAAIPKNFCKLAVFPELVPS